MRLYNRSRHVVWNLQNGDGSIKLTYAEYAKLPEDEPFARWYYLRYGARATRQDYVRYYPLWDWSMKKERRAWLIEWAINGR